MLKKILAAALIAGGLIAGGSSAFASPLTNAVPTDVPNVVSQVNGVDDVPSLNLDAQRFNEGGGALGYGAASLVSSAYLGVGTSAIDAGKYIVDPGSLHFVPGHK
ncbi:MAG: hypothetical protein ACRDRN_20245 [Sciscionella sp.]